MPMEATTDGECKQRDRNFGKIEKEVLDQQNCTEMKECL